MFCFNGCIQYFDVLSAWQALKGHKRNFRETLQHGLGWNGRHARMEDVV